MSEGAEASASVSSVVLGLLLGTQDGSHSCRGECNHRFFEYIDLLVSLLHFLFGIVHVIIENPRHPMLSLYLRSSQNWLRFFVPTISVPPVQTSNLCVLQLQRASFALPLFCCSGEVPYILPRVGHFTRMKAATVSRSHLCFILRCIYPSIKGLGWA